MEGFHMKCRGSKKTVFSFVLSVVMFVLAAGCSSNGDGKQAENTPDPVTITIAMRNGYLEDDEFQRYVAEPVKKKYPHIYYGQERVDDQREIFA
jgi:hypothetical protein